jgi:hypothetical protein
MIFVEFSFAQKAFHKSTIVEMIKNNYKNVLARRQTDYVPIGVFDSHDEADEFINANNDKIKDFSMYRSAMGETIVIQ